MRWTAAIGWTAVVLAVGCEQPRTELVARVDSDIAWGPDLRVQSVVISVRRGGATGPLRSARTTALGVGGERRVLPLYVGVIADSDINTPVWIEALGCGDPSGCTAATAVVAQRAVVPFARGETLEVSLVLAARCAGVTCANEERCAVAGGQCEPATRARETVRPFGGTDAAIAMDQPTAVDAPLAIDARADVPPTVDAGDDVPIDTGPRDVPVGDRGADSVCPTGMRLIPAGTFLMGDPIAGHVNAQPVHGVSLSAYCIDETEVTVATYQACVAAGQCTSAATTAGCNATVAGRGNHPINCVTWTQANAACMFRGGRLPTEAQWEYAALRDTRRSYPWGDAPPTTQLCWSGGGATQSSSCEVQTHPTGNSPFGLFDMAGNVWEWVFDWSAAYMGNATQYVGNPAGAGETGARVIRGGSWADTMTEPVRSSVRSSGAPTIHDVHGGFRCSHVPL